MNSDTILLAFVGLFIKHFLADFPLQTHAMVSHKGTYGHPQGLFHSGIHAIFTFLVLILVLQSFTLWRLALALALLDGLIHYHIDFLKMRFGTRDVRSSAFWNQLGLDQLAHSMTYVGLIALAVLFY